MMNLHSLQNTHRPAKKSRRVGRGVGCKKGKTCGRGAKGDKSRSGYKTRTRKEGGQGTLFQRLPTRGFSQEKFRKELFAINLDLIEQLYEDGETVSLATLREKGYNGTKMRYGIKVLGMGELKKKVLIEADAYSKTAVQKLEAEKIEFRVTA